MDFFNLTEDKCFKLLDRKEHQFMKMEISNTLNHYSIDKYNKYLRNILSYIADQKLSPASIKVIAHLIKIDDGKFDFYELTLRDLSINLGYTDKTTMSAMDELTHHKLIKKHKSSTDARRNKYRLILI